MLAEMALLQRLTLLLGQPGLSLAVALAGLLLGAGLGAATGARGGGDGRGPARLLLGAAGVLALEAVALSLVWGPLLGWPAPGRIAVALGAGLLPGYLMGPALPAGAALLGRSDPAVLPWLWAVNGAASAAGAALALMLAMEWGGPGGAPAGRRALRAAGGAAGRRAGGQGPCWPVPPRCRCRA